MTKSISLLILTLSLFFSPAIIAQQDDLLGVFWSDSSHYVQLNHGNKAEFLIAYGCCLVVDTYGQGRFELQDSVLRIRVGKAEPNKRSHHQVGESLYRSDSLHFTVYDQGNPLPFCNVVIKGKENKKIVVGSATNDSGQVGFLVPEGVKASNFTVEFSIVGKDTYTVDLSQLLGKTCRVNLVPYELLEDGVVEFRITESEGNLYLMGPYFPKNEEARSQKRGWRMFSGNKPKGHNEGAYMIQSFKP